jgi:hypothetical protein
MYIAVQRYQTTLNRHIGTPMSQSTPLISYGATAAPSLITTNLRVNLDSSNVPEPQDVIMRLPTANQPGPYFLRNDVWTDSSGNGNNGIFNRSDSDNRSSKYHKEDLLIPEIRFHDSTVNKIYGASFDFLETPYFGLDNATFTFGGWFKVNSTHNNFLIARGKDGNGNGWNIMLSGSLGNRVGINIVGVSSGGQTSFTGTTTLQSETWYNVYGVWKPNSYAKLYINGVRELNASTTITAVRSSTAGWGINRNHNTNWFGRSIVGAFHVYDRELSEAEIVQNFEATRRKYNV